MHEGAARAAPHRFPRRRARNGCRRLPQHDPHRGIGALLPRTASSTRSQALAALARERNLWLHVDACVGGFLAPFVRRLGYPIPPFDFAVEGVRSMSADLHKYGFAAKGASVMLLADQALRRHLVFEFDNWPRGKYAVATFAGSRPGGAIAAAWAVMRYLGVEGYTRLARTIMEARERLENGNGAIEGLYVVGTPELSVDGRWRAGLDIFAVAEQMTKKGWFVSTMSEPPAFIWAC